MDTLRWIIVAAGVVLLVVIYAWGRNKERRRRPTRDIEPSLDEEMDGQEFNQGMRSIRDELVELGEIISEEDAADASKISMNGNAAGVSVSGMEKIISLYVVLPKDEPVSGPDLLEGLHAAGLNHGEMNIFHRQPDDKGTSVFSVANLVEPGTLNPDDMEDFSSPGVVFFMRLPGPVEGWAALDDLVASARQLAESIGGRVLDETRNPLTQQAVEHLRQEIGEFQRRRRLALNTA